MGDGGNIRRTWRMKSSVKTRAGCPVKAKVTLSKALAIIRTGSYWFWNGREPVAVSATRARERRYIRRGGEAMRHAGVTAWTFPHRTNITNSTTATGERSLPTSLVTRRVSKLRRIPQNVRWIRRSNSSVLTKTPVLPLQFNSDIFKNPDEAKRSQYTWHIHPNKIVAICWLYVTVNGSPLKYMY